MAMLALPLSAGKARLTSCNVVFSLCGSSLRAFDGFVGFPLWASFGYPVYLRSPHAFFNKIFYYLSKKKISLFPLLIIPTFSQDKHQIKLSMAFCVEKYWRQIDLGCFSSRICMQYKVFELSSSSSARTAF